LVGTELGAPGEAVRAPDTEKGAARPTTKGSDTAWPTVLPRKKLGLSVRKLKAMLRNLVRSTSATTTSSWTCWTPATRRALMTWKPTPWATATHTAASSARATVPVKVTVLLL